MQSLRDIKRRIHSVKNIAQITKAMEVVSMTKMRRSQQFAFRARPYALASLDMLKNLLERTPRKFLPTLLRERAVSHALLAVVTTDKGLVGGFNDEVLRRADAWIKEQEKNNIPYAVVTVGKKARDYYERKGINVLKSFVDFGDYTHFHETEPVAHFLLSCFNNHEYDVVDVVYTHFKTTLLQKTELKKLLPTKKESLEEIIQEIIPEYGLYSDMHENKPQTKYMYSYTFEPSPEAIISTLTENILKIAFHHMLLESNASEHSARMVTMKNASDNAGELKDSLTLEMNKARQAGITAEISEIIAGAEALQ